MCKHQLTQVIQWKFVPTCQSSSTPIFLSEHNILGSNTQFLWRGIIGVPVFVTLRQSYSTVFEVVAKYFLPFTLNSRSSAALSPCPDHSHTLSHLNTTHDTANPLVKPYFLHIRATFTSFLFWPTCVVTQPLLCTSDTSPCMLPHSGTGHQQPPQILENHAASTVHYQEHNIMIYNKYFENQSTWEKQ
jgi:hypothetical protein